MQRAAIRMGCGGSAIIHRRDAFFQAKSYRVAIEKNFWEENFVIKHGDIIFTQIGSSQNAISAVTEGYRGAHVNHVGVALKNNKGTFVLEAFPPEVRVTNIDVFLRRSNDAEKKPRYLVGRLNSSFSSLVPLAIDYGLQLRDLPYDQFYLTDEKALYCSELVVDMFKAANGGEPFVVERPMSFRDKVTGEILEAWTHYYQQFGMEVPDGEPGSNPGDISKDPRLEVVHIEGKLTGYHAS